MNKLEAKEIRQGMSLAECIAMWNESTQHYEDKVFEIHEMDDDNWWEYIAERTGAYCLMWYLLHNSEDSFCRYDEYFLYNENNNTFFSFTSKEEMLEDMEEFFIDEIMNRN